jgi:uncharacterized protein YrrD
MTDLKDWIGVKVYRLHNDHQVGGVHTVINTYSLYGEQLQLDNGEWVYLHQVLRA